MQTPNRARFSFSSPTLQSALAQHGAAKGRAQHQTASATGHPTGVFPLTFGIPLGTPVGTTLGYRDMYSVPHCGTSKAGLDRVLELAYAVLYNNDSKHSGAESTILGPTGHYERASAVVHILGFLGFLAYALGRLLTTADALLIEEKLATAAAFTTALVFLSSTVYHVTAPDKFLSSFTRILDYAGIYGGLCFSTTADIAAATNGFKNTPIHTWIDLPLSAALLLVFFMLRRVNTDPQRTWKDNGTCFIDGGLFSSGHHDLEHGSTRQSTSLLLFGSYFLSSPAAFATLGTDVAGVVVGLQLAGLLTVVAGMAVDRIFRWPDERAGWLKEGQHNNTCACPAIGCAMNSHAIWHVFAIASAAFAVASRELALDTK